MTTVLAVKVTPQGVLVPRPLIAALGGDVEEVEIEQRSDAIIIKPKTKRASQLRAQILREMKAAGLIEDLSWEQPPVISPKERARLAKQLSHGKPLSEIIIEDREQPA
jgi:antitoxin component of MazEF toxin-antitoxin module